MTTLDEAIERNRARIAKEEAEFQAWKAKTIAAAEAEWFLADWDEAIRENGKK
jgi:hypothetical protein